MKNRISVLLIGLGHMGGHHLKKFLLLPEVELFPVELNKERREELQKKYQLQIYENYDALLKKVDAAVIATPTITHYDIAKKCLELGLDILIEKPATETIEQSLELKKIAQKNECIIQVGHLERFNPVFKKCKAVLKNPLFVEAHRLGVVKERSYDVDVILDLMIHDLDIVLSLVKSPIKKVEALGVPLLTDKVDLANARIYFENEAVANLVASRVSLKEMRKIRFFQEGGYVSIDTASNTVSISQLDEEKQFSYEEIKGCEGDALESEIKSFLQCVKTRNAPEVSIEDAIASLSLAYEIRSSIEKKLNRVKKKYHAPILSGGV